MQTLRFEWNRSTYKASSTFSLKKNSESRMKLAINYDPYKGLQIQTFPYFFAYFYLDLEEVRILFEIYAVSYPEFSQTANSF